MDMTWKYKYERKDKSYDKKFSKKYVPSRWVGDYDNNCVRDYDKYIVDSLKNGSISEEDIPYISYIEGTYEQACKFFQLSGENCKVYDKKTKEYAIKKDEDSREVKIKRLENLMINCRALMKSTAV